MTAPGGGERNILTVLRSGGEYHPEHVERLRDQCTAFSDARFHCLSDVSVPGRIEMRHDWPGWWAKMEMFRLPGPWLYMDLDTTVRGDLDPLLTPRPFIALRDFYYGGVNLGSGLMAWDGCMMGLYLAFARNPAVRADYTRRGKLGDQGFIQDHGPTPRFWQDVMPGSVVSWKVDCRRGIPGTARVVCFHGRPRPWEVAH